MNFLGIFSNYFGMIKGKFIGEPPSYVDKTKIPGMSPIPKPTLSEWIINAPFVLITSPDFIWSSIALSV
jgi:hypothetical protein